MSKVVLFESDMECCGCSACECICPKHAISMKENNEGFLYPIIDSEACIECKMCQRVCPVRNFDNEKLKVSTNGKTQIGIISLSYTDNFGAKIVTYSLKKKIEEIIPDCNVNVIQFLPNLEQEGFLQLVKKRIKEQGLVKPALHFLLHKTNMKKHSKEFTIRQENYRDFDEKYLPIALNTPKVLDFKTYVSQLDAIVVGSDIVFRPEFAELYPEVFFLGCLNCRSGVRKISYAASIGTDSSDTLTPLEASYKDGIKNFDFISVREKKSQEFLQGLTDKNVEFCCDPVMLCDASYFDFETNLKQPPKKYIYLYILDRNKKALAYAKKLAKLKNLDIYYFAEQDLDGKNIYNVFTDGPAEFVQRIKNAEYVITNSFHSIVFSILFKKPFVAFMRTRQSLKITNILEMFGMQDRGVVGNEKCDIDKPIDWNEVHSKLARINQSSTEYLKNALKDLK